MLSRPHLEITTPEAVLAASERARHTPCLIPGDRVRVEGVIMHADARAVQIRLETGQTIWVAPQGVATMPGPGLMEHIRQLSAEGLDGDTDSAMDALAAIRTLAGGPS